MTLSRQRVASLVSQETAREIPQVSSNLVFLDLEPPEIDAQESIITWLKGGTETPPARLLYDEKGAMLFEAICATPEYYLTHCETSILPRVPGALKPYLHDVVQIVEYGSGNNHKIARLLEALPQIKAHVPIDISKSHLLANAQALAVQHPERQFTAICADFFQDFDLPVRPRGIPVTQNIGFFPGSTIGNMPNAQAIKLLSNARRALGPDCLFILAADRVKETHILEAAYGDEQGHSAGFSLNLIDRINATMNGSLDKSCFDYRAHFNEASQAIEMRWRVKESHSAKVGDVPMSFTKGQSFLVEISRKFTPDSLHQLASASGFEMLECLSDPQDWYSIAILRGK